jgi:two-component system response regulator AtoC
MSLRAFVVGGEALVAELEQHDIEAAPRSDAALMFVALDATEKAVDDAFASALEHEIPLIVVARDPSVAQTVTAVRRGAVDVLTLPLRAAALRDALTRVRIRAAAAPSTEPLTAEHGLIGDSKAMRLLKEQIDRAAPASSTVLVRGESGTGKELVARAMHDASGRADGPFVKVHCAALPEQLLASELFGFEKGAFTGAAARRLGRLDVAHGGSLFLDEIGDISAATQVKLLRLLQDRQYERLGSNQTLDADVRVITATHRDLEAMIKEGTFREDLFYRLNVVVLWVPPLRNRRSDIEVLARTFFARFAHANSRRVVITDEALKLLRKQRWPGNVRELQNIVERLVVLGDGDEITTTDVERELQGSAPFITEVGESIIITGASPEVIPLSEKLRAAEKEAIGQALAHTGGDKKLAARLLGISRSTLYTKLAEHDLT